MTRFFISMLLVAMSAITFAAEKNFSAYLFAYFKGEGLAQGEQIYFAASRDGLNWKDLNGGNPVLTSSLGEKGLRDPFIMRSADGDKFALSGNHAGDRRDERRAPVAFSREFAQKFFVVCRAVAVSAGIACREDAGSAAERVHAKSGIVRDAGHIAVLAAGNGFQHGVFLKGFTRFLHLAERDPLFGSKKHANTERSKDSVQFFSFFLIMSGD